MINAVGTAFPNDPKAVGACPTYRLRILTCSLEILHLFKGFPTSLSNGETVTVAEK